MDRSSFIGVAASMLAAPRVGPPTALPQLPPSRKRALVLTGGGARGAYQGGVLAGFAKMGQKFDIVVGTSIGAINGALFSQGDDLGELWHNVSNYRLIRSIPTLTPLLVSLGEIRDNWRGVVSRPYNVLHGAVRLYDGGRIFDRTYFFDSEPITEFLNHHLDMDRIEGSFGWTATNLTASRTESFYIAPKAARYDDPLGITQLHRLDADNDADRAMYPNAIRASAALPLVFEPVVLQPRGMREPQQYADGGVVTNAPIALARHLGATDLVGVGVDPPLKPATVDSLFGVIFSAFSTNQTRLIFDQLLDASAGPAVQSLSIVRPQKELAVGPIDFNKQNELDEAFATGYADGIAGPRPITLGQE